MAGVDLAGVKDVVLTHMHYDHAGNHEIFPNARYHIQDREMEYCTGRCMCHSNLRHPFEAEDVTAMVRKLFQGRVKFHDGASEIADGVSVHLVGGHSRGLAVRAGPHPARMGGARLGRLALLCEFRTVPAVPCRG